jgi:hypothetical protein
MEIEVREVQDSKAPTPMVFTEVGMEMEVREVQESKAQEPISNTVVGIKTERIAKQ